MDSGCGCKRWMWNIEMYHKVISATRYAKAGDSWLFGQLHASLNSYQSSSFITSPSYSMVLYGVNVKSSGVSIEWRGATDFVQSGLCLLICLIHLHKPIITVTTIVIIIIIIHPSSRDSLEQNDIQYSRDLERKKRARDWMNFFFPPVYFQSFLCQRKFNGVSPGKLVWFMELFCICNWYVWWCIQQKVLV